MLGKYQMIKWHRRLWKWVYTTNARMKHGWPGWDDEKAPKINSLCFPCDYAHAKYKKLKLTEPCLLCPMNWKKYGRCNDDNSIYYNWSEMLRFDSVTRRDLAFIIWNLQLIPYKQRSLSDFNRRFK